MSSCGDGAVNGTETCDPCPSTCSDSNSCTTDSMTGSASTCDLVCTHTAITACTAGDTCCPAGCSANNDSDCSVTCGNGSVESGETCDPVSSCPASCDDSQACTLDMQTGSAANCNIACTHTAITACANGDGCCPSGCNKNTDSDCSAICGNGAVESGETCDPPGSCPTSCDDSQVCTADGQTGSAATCNIACTHTAITACANGDGCCPNGCNASNDSDCVASCGNNVVEPGETCDPVSSCPANCADSDACTVDTQTGGSPATCNIACTHTTITACNGGDGCCAAGCNANNDSDCFTTCGNGVVEAGETCDPPSSCPINCDDGNACTNEVQSGSPASCNMQCTFTVITACTNGDGCCASGCTNANDNDCP